VHIYMNICICIYIHTSTHIHICIQRYALCYILDVRDWSLQPPEDIMYVYIYIYM